MAYSTSNKFNNAIVGTPFVGADVDIYEVTSSPKFQVGTGFTRSDGAEFRYAHFTGVLYRAGLVVAQDFSESGTAQLDSVCTTPANSTMVPGFNIKPNEIGSQHIQFTKGAGDNQYAGGYIMIGNGTGEGYTYRIRESDDGVVSGSTVLTIYGRVKAALDATSDFAIYGSEYANLESISATVGTDTTPVGVNCAASLTADRYGWVQKKGVVGILRDSSTLAAGSMLRCSDQEAGRVSIPENSVLREDGTESANPNLFDSPIFGYCIDAAADNEFAMCYINL